MDATSGPSENYDEYVLRGLTIKNIQSALPWVSRTESEVLNLRFIKGCKLDETAKIMGVPIHNVRITEHQALTAIRNEQKRAQEPKSEKKKLSKIELLNLVEKNIKKVEAVRDRRILKFFYGFETDEMPSHLAVIKKFNLDPEYLQELIEDFEGNLSEVMKEMLR